MPPGDAEWSMNFSFDPNDVFEPKVEQAFQSRAQAFQAACTTDQGRRAQYLLRPDAGHVPLGAQSDHRRDRLAHDRTRLRRLRKPLLGLIRYFLSLDRVFALFR